MPIEVPIGGEIITSAWGKSVADQINRLSSILDALEPQRYSASAALALTSNWQDVPGAVVTITPPELETWLIIAVFSFRFPTPGNPGSLAQGVILNNGVIQAGTAQAPAGDGGSSTATQVTTLFPSPSGQPYTIKLQACTSGTVSGAEAQATHTRLIIQRLPRTIG